VKRRRRYSVENEGEGFGWLIRNVRTEDVVAHSISTKREAEKMIAMWPDRYLDEYEITEKSNG
jgi:hypothetical protein